MEKEERLTLEEFIDSAVEQVSEVFALDERDSQRFRNAFSKIAIEDILSVDVNASNENQECYAFTSANSVMTSNITYALCDVNLPTVLPEGRSLLTTMIPVDEVSRSEAIALKEKLEKEVRFRLSLVEFIDSAVEQVTKVFALDEEDSEKFRNAFSEVAIEDILSGHTNASDGDQECYGFGSVTNMMTFNIAIALYKANLPTLLPEGRYLLTEMIPVDEVSRSEAIALKDQMVTVKDSQKGKVKIKKNK